MKKLRVGDTVNWRGSWGRDPKKPAKVEGIEITNGDKYGYEVSEVDWKKVYGRNVTVDLDNGHWAYADQISPIR